MTDSTLLSSRRRNDWRSPVSQVLRSTQVNLGTVGSDRHTDPMPALSR